MSEKNSHDQLKKYRKLTNIFYFEFTNIISFKIQIYART